MNPFLNFPKFGKTLEVDLLGPVKICNFDCIYCSLGPTTIKLNTLRDSQLFANISEIIQSYSKSLTAAAKSGVPYETILVSGNGESTLHPQFDLAINSLRQVSRELNLKTQIVVLTNGANLADRSVHSALQLCDEVVLKLDTGTAAGFKAINRPLVRLKLELLIQNARGIPHISVQTAILKHRQSPEINSISEWLELVKLLSPKAIYLFSPDRTMLKNDLETLNENELYELAHWIDRAYHLKTQLLLSNVA